MNKYLFKSEQIPLHPSSDTISEQINIISGVINWFWIIVFLYWQYDKHLVDLTKYIELYHLIGWLYTIKGPENQI